MPPAAVAISPGKMPQSILLRADEVTRSSAGASKTAPIRRSGRLGSACARGRRQRGSLIPWSAVLNQ